MDLIQTGWSPLYNRYNDWAWELDPNASLLDDLSTGCAFFGKGSGTKLLSEGNAVYGTPTSASQWTASSHLKRRCWSFNGSNQKVQVFGVASTTTCTLHCWAKVASYGNDLILSVRTSSTDRLAIAASSAGKISFQWYDGTNYGPSGACDNDWHALALTRNVSTIRGFIDGIEVSDAGAYVDHALNDGFYLGWGRINYYDGLLADVLYLPRILSDSEIRQLASRRPDLNGAIRSTIPQFIPSITSTPSSSTPQQSPIWVGV